MKTYPIMLNVQGRSAVVVGGGRIGRRRAMALREAGAEVRQVAPEVAREALEGVTLLREEYRPEHLDGAWLVLACTNDLALNSRIAADARNRGALVNVADQPADCDFYLPAVTARGDVVVAVGTGGSAPALSGLLRDRLADSIPERIDEFASALSQLRTELRDRLTDGSQRMGVMKALSDDEGYRLYVDGGTDALRDRMAAMLEGMSPHERSGP